MTALVVCFIDLNTTTPERIGIVDKHGKDHHKTTHIDTCGWRFANHICLLEKEEESDENDHY